MDLELEISGQHRLRKLIGPLRLLNNLCRLCWEPVRHRDRASCIRDKTRAMYSLRLCVYSPAVQAWPRPCKNHVCTGCIPEMRLRVNNNWRITKFRECRRKQKEKKKEKKNYHLFRQSASKTSTQATSYSRFQAIRYMRCYLISVTVFQALYLSCFIGTYYGTKNVMQRFPLTPFYKQFSFFICLLYMYIYIYICMSRNLSSTFMKQFW